MISITELLSSLRLSSEEYNRMVYKHKAAISFSQWEDTASSILENASKLALSSRTGQLAIMYLLLAIAKNMVQPSLLSFFAVAALRIATKFEGPRERDFTLFFTSPDRETMKSLNELERFMLEDVLSWKLSLATPFDFISLITEKMKDEKEEKETRATVETMRQKAVCLSDLLLLSSSQSACSQPMAIAVASLVTACNVVKKKDWAKKLAEEHTTEEISESVESLLEHLKKELVTMAGQDPSCTAPNTPEPQREVQLAGKRGYSEESLETNEELTITTKRFHGEDLYYKE